MGTSPPPALAHAPATGSTLIRLEGADALALLHRISTQSLEDLEPGHARTTLFCDFRGRLLHRAAVCVTRDGAAWLLRDDAPAGELMTYIDRHVFRDDVRMMDASASHSVRSVHGGLGLPAGSVSDREGIPHAVQIGDDLAFAVEPEPQFAPDPGTERLRILAGRPRHGHEVRELFNPYEVGLAHEVHLSKGCFSGQEALMRMMTYRGVRRRLAKVAGSGEPPSVPGQVRLDRNPVGVLTSAAVLEHDWIGLAVLGREAIEPGARLEIEGGGPIESVEAFPETHPLGLP